MSGRAIQSRRLPAARQQLLFVGFLGVAVVTATATLLSRVIGPAGAFSPLLSAVTYIVVVGIALTGIDRFHPFSRLGPANLVTLLRTILVALLAWSFAVDVWWLQRRKLVA